MKFRGIRQIISETNAWRETSEALRDLFQGLVKLSFTDNFESMEYRNITIAANSYYDFGNRLAFIPSKWFIVGTNNGVPVGDENKVNWTATNLRLRNYSLADDTIISVVFMR